LVTLKNSAVGCLLAWALEPARTNETLIRAQQEAMVNRAMLSPNHFVNPMAVPPLYDSNHGPSSSSVLLRLDQCSITRRLLLCPQTDGSEHTWAIRPARVESPPWLVDQIYIMLNSLHEVLKPLVEQRVPQDQQIRKFTDKRKFMQNYTAVAIDLFRQCIPLYFETAAGAQMLPSHAVHRVICDLLRMAPMVKGQRSSSLTSFKWSEFWHSEDDHATAAHEALCGYLNGVSINLLCEGSCVCISATEPPLKRQRQHQILAPSPLGCCLPSGNLSFVSHCTHLHRQPGP
jgi:hypothetical protein